MNFVLHKNDLVHGPITRTMLSFAFPMILGNLLQQFYNIADTLIVGQFLGADALAAGRDHRPALRRLLPTHL